MEDLALITVNPGRSRRDEISRPYCPSVQEPPHTDDPERLFNEPNKIPDHYSGNGDNDHVISIVLRLPSGAIARHCLTVWPAEPLAFFVRALFLDGNESVFNFLPGNPPDQR